MRALQHLTLEDIEPAAGFRLPPRCLLFLSKSYDGREQMLQHASLAQATVLEVDGYRRSGPGIPLPLGKPQKLLPHLKTLILTVWPDRNSASYRIKHDIADYQGIPNVILKFRTRVELRIPPHPWQSLIIEGKGVVDMEMSNPELFVQRVGCFRFQSVHQSMNAAKHFGTGLKTACTKLGLPYFSSSSACTPLWKERYTAVASNRKEALCGWYIYRGLDCPITAGRACRYATRLR